MDFANEGDLAVHFFSFSGKSKNISMREFESRKTVSGKLPMRY